MIEMRLPGARVVFTDRADGDLRRAGAEAKLDVLAGRPVAWGRQIHGAAVTRVADRGAAPLVEADGQATARRDVAVGVRVADCLPVAIAATGAVAVVHAGWRGLAAGVLEEGVRAVRALGASGALAAAVGPGAGPCCYGIGDDVRAVFGTTEATLDLPALARARLAAAGVERVEDAGVCSICDRRHFSVRRDGAMTGRQAGIAWLI